MPQANREVEEERVKAPARLHLVGFLPLCRQLPVMHSSYEGGKDAERALIVG